MNDGAHNAALGGDFSRASSSPAAGQRPMPCGIPSTGRDSPLDSRAVALDASGRYDGLWCHHANSRQSASLCPARAYHPPRCAFLTSGRRVRDPPSSRTNLRFLHHHADRRRIEPPSEHRNRPGAPPHIRWSRSSSAWAFNASPEPREAISRKLFSGQYARSITRMSTTRLVRAIFRRQLPGIKDVVERDGAEEISPKPQLEVRASA